MSEQRTDFSPLRSLLSNEGDMQRLEGLQAAMVARLENVMHVEQQGVEGVLSQEQRARVVHERAMLREAIEWVGKRTGVAMKAKDEA